MWVFFLLEWLFLFVLFLELKKGCKGSAFKDPSFQQNDPEEKELMSHGERDKVIEPHVIVMQSTSQRMFDR